MMVEDITQDEWEEYIAKDDKAVIIDVRTAEEVAEGYIPNMIHIDIRKPEEFTSEILKLDPSKHYYVYCRSGARSGQACSFMEENGFETTYNLEGGFMNWTGEVAE